MKKLLLPLVLMLASSGAVAQQREYTPSPVKGAAWNTPGNLNPFIPGYFADPTIRKFGDTYYLYATTDGTGNGYGPAQVWVSKDFVNWKNVILNWPTTEVVWAPDVVQQPDGKFRYYYCEPCNINIGESYSPLGPWKNILGKSDAVMVPDRYVHNVITLDPQLFTDDDHQQYLYFTTWGIYDGFGCGVARLNDGAYNIEDLQKMPSARRWNENNPYEIAADKFFAEKAIIPNTQLKDIFEAPFVFKRNGVYYFTYSSGSCHTDTYRVQYATSTVGPMGPFEYKGELLTTNEDGTVHGPGHHSILEDDGHYYIVYHRHDIPKAIHGFNRQVCIDELTFDEQGNINPIVPTHDGLLPASLAKKAEKARKNACVNLAFGAKATASSYYKTPSLSGRAGEGLEFFLPSHATDDNNATLWKAADCNAPAWLQIDLGKVQKFNQVWTQFEFPTFFYQYKIETSTDGNSWSLYADRTDNTQQGSPMVDEGATTARFVRITITDTQKNGHFPAIWNVKVFNATKKNNPLALLPNTDNIDLEAVNRGYPSLHKKDVEQSDREVTKAKNNLIIDIEALPQPSPKGEGVQSREVNEIVNKQGGKFSSQGNDLIVEIKKGKYAFYFDGETTMTSDFTLPKTMTYNAPYTITAWTLNPTVEGIETVAEFTQRRNDLATIEFRQGTDRQSGLVAHNASFENFGCPRECKEGAGEWQHWTVAYDGYMERIYLNGKLVTEKNSFLMIRPEGNITLGSSMDGANKFSGYLHSLRFYDRCLSAEEIVAQFNEPSSTTDRMSLATIDMQLRAEVLTPEYIKMSVVDGAGKPIRSGMLSYTYNIEDKVEDGKSKAKGSTFKKLCTAVVSDDEKTFTKTLTTIVDVNPAQFNVMRHTEPMRLSGAGADFTDNPLENGAKVLETVTGDFVMQARVSGFDGFDTKKTPAYNEAGIIAIEAYPQSSESNPNGVLPPSRGELEGGFAYIHNGVFPSYNCGNMLTQVKHGRPQFPVQNGWQYDPWVQLQRVGNLVYARRSADGKTWVDMPGSPMEVASPTLQVGVYQTTYTNNESWAELADFIVWQKK